MTKRLSPVERQSIIDLMIVQAYPPPPSVAVCADAHGCSASTVRRIIKQWDDRNREIMTVYAAGISGAAEQED